MVVGGRVVGYVGGYGGKGRYPIGSGSSGGDTMTTVMENDPNGALNQFGLINQYHGL